jgi:hypothetical protein
MYYSIYKPLVAVIFLSLLVSGCSREDGRIKQVPDDIIKSKACPTLYTSIMDQFPEYRNNETNQELLFSAEAEKRILVTKETKVYAAFISEGAGYSNSFGWYTYQDGNPPTSVDDLELNILFPSVSNNVLEQGDMLQLGEGTFQPGTVIGFFLIVGGWQGGTVNYDKPTIYSDFSLNTGGQQQHVLFKQKDCGDIVLAFEDRMLNESSDADFNDIIFTVTDNTDELEVTAIDFSKIIQL